MLWQTFRFRRWNALFRRIFTCSWSMHLVEGSGHRISLSGLCFTKRRPSEPSTSKSSRPFCRSCLTIRNSSSVFESIALLSSDSLRRAISVPFAVFSSIFRDTMAAWTLASKAHILLMVLCIFSTCFLVSCHTFLSLLVTHTIFKDGIFTRQLVPSLFFHPLSWCREKGLEDRRGAKEQN